MLKCDGITKVYGKKTVLSNFSMEFGAGVYGVLGPNGAGKSTLFRIVAGILLPTAGTVTWNGVEIHKLGAEYRTGLGVLPQQMPFYSWMKGREYLEYIHELKGLPRLQRKSDVETMLGKVELLGDAEKKIRAYSGGMKQRLGIAQALLGTPRLILLDEPTAGLDPRQSVVFKNIVREISVTSTVILCTHIISDLSALAETILMLQSGNLIAVGSPDALTGQLAGKVWWLSETEENLMQYPNATRMLMNGQAGLKVIAESTPPANGIQIAPSLEDLYQYHFKEASQ